jgi:hypothetical protein
MMIRIIRQASGSVNGVSLSHYKTGRCYDLEPSIAEFLVLHGHGLIEMRKTRDCLPDPGPRERRRKIR